MAKNTTSKSKATEEVAKGKNVYKGYILVNADKLHRAIYGSIGDKGRVDGTGAGENASAEEILVAYDRLGGLILKGKAKVKPGCFYDFEKKVAFKKPEVILVFRDLKGRAVELEEGDEIPVEVQAAEKIREEEEEELKEKADKKKKDKADKKNAGSKKTAKAGAEDEGEEEELSGGEEDEDEEEVDEDVE